MAHVLGNDKNNVEQARGHKLPSLAYNLGPTDPDAGFSSTHAAERMIAWVRGVFHNTHALPSSYA